MILLPICLLVFFDKTSIFSDNYIYIYIYKVSSMSLDRAGKWK